MAGLFTGLSNALFGGGGNKIAPQSQSQFAVSPEIFNQYQQMLTGGGPATSQLPGYESMLSARGDALGDLATGRAGMGKLFSGSTAQAASDIGGEMEMNLRNQYMNMLMGEVGQGRNMEMQREMARQQQSQQQANRSAGIFGDVLGAGALLMASDVNLKHDIKYLGKRGKYNWYQWKYDGSNTTYEGPMAQEVRMKNPAAVYEIDGNLMIDLRAL